ncbi:MAG: FKBP-type peptidyl-prolyl cis-trans isomerase [Bacteroidales bacterium]|nr:FKBP-type peptidyl-prolyl cis-trans isomerase [Bacteroidales bacterium]
MKKIVISIIIAILIIPACKFFSKYPEYSKTKTGIYYHLFKIGEDAKKPELEDYITVDLVYRTMSDSLFFRGRRTLQLSEPDFEGAIDECFIMLAEGDSASFIISADGLFNKTLNTSLPRFIPQNSLMKVDILMVTFRTAKEYKREKEEFLKWIEDFGDYEKLVLKRFIEEDKINVEPIDGNLYYLQIKEGTGKEVEIGDLITVHYEGRFLNGKFFDSTKKRNQPLEFVYGTEWQVIKGLERGIGMMKEGGKAVLIFPSELAWGNIGSTTGIIPPFTSVIFEVEILKVVPREEINKS